MDRQKIIDDTILVKEVNSEGKVFEKGKWLDFQSLRSMTGVFALLKFHRAAKKVDH